MRYLLTLLIIVHGLIHLMGFAKAFGFAEIPQIPKEISKIQGFIWLFVAIGLVTTAIGFFLKKDWWWSVGLIMVIISQVLIITNWESSKYGTIANVIILALSLTALASARFTNSYHQDVRELLLMTKAPETEILTEADLTGLPLPVQKYIRLTGSIGKPKIRNFLIEFNGKIRQKESAPWMPFSSEQFNFITENARLFFMQAVMKKLPVKGYHRFRNGQASMDIRLFSLFPVQKQSGERMNISETVTFFNDMCCMAPATLIDDRIHWIKTEDNKVLAEFHLNDTKISAWLHFNNLGELINFISDDRYAMQEDGSMKQFTWSTPLQNYKLINGYRLASYAEAIYGYPEGDFCYGIFELSSLEINLKNLQGK